MIEFKEGCHYYAVWFASNGTSEDWFMGFWREADGKLIARYRHRYYTDPAPFAEGDVKNWYQLNIKSESDPRVIMAKLNSLVAIIALRLPFVDHIEIDGDCDKAMALMKE